RPALHRCRDHFACECGNWDRGRFANRCGTWLCRVELGCARVAHYVTDAKRDPPRQWCTGLPCVGPASSFCRSVIFAAALVYKTPISRSRESEDSSDSSCGGDPNVDAPRFGCTDPADRIDLPASTFDFVLRAPTCASMCSYSVCWVW